MSDHDHVPFPVDPRIEAAAAEGCEESRLLISRRAALGLSASFFTWAFMPRLGEASSLEISRSNDPRLLFVILRGGMDGLNVVVPTGDPNYLCQRGALALTSNLLELNGYFKLHPSLAFFHSLYQQNDALAVHAIAPPLHIRSHFECQRNLENGDPDGRQDVTRGGWLNRLLLAMPKGSPVTSHGGALQIGPTPLILSGDASSGKAKVLSWSPTLWPQPATFNNAVLDLYRKTDTALHDMLRESMDLDETATAKTYKGADLPANPTNLQRSFRGAAQLLSADKGGARIAVLNVEGWDTHAIQAQTLGINLADLDNGLKDFHTIASKGSFWDDTVIVIVTEFGRSARANGANGTDHGVGTVALLAGGKVNGGRVVLNRNEWPGLADGRLLENRDLKATYDLRQLFKGVLRQHLGIVDQRLLDETLFRQSSGVDEIPDLVCSNAPKPQVPPQFTPQAVASAATANAATPSAKATGVKSAGGAVATKPAAGPKLCESI